VTRGFDESADVKGWGRYQAALTSAQFVGVLAPGAQRSMIREVRTMFGKDAMRLTGIFRRAGDTARAPAARSHGPLHGGESRSRPSRRGAGPERQNPRDGRAGYTVLERAISSDFADAVRDATIKALLPHQTTSMNWMLYHGANSSS